MNNCYSFSVHGFDLNGLAEADPYVAHLNSMVVPEPHLLNFLSANCTQSTTVRIADVGANIGFTALLMSRAYPDATVHAFEPGPNVFSLMRMNVSGKRIVPVHAAVSDRNGTACFAENSAFGHLASSGVEVPTISLGDYLDGRGLSHFDFVKIDVEGFERDVFRGLKGRASFVFFELNSFALTCYGNISPVALLDEIIKDWDLYEFLTPERLGRVTDLVATIHRNMVSSGCVTDLIAVPKGTALVTELPNAAPAKAIEAPAPPAVSEADVLRSELNAVYQSMSWRVTAPLRSVNALLKRGTGARE